VMGGDVIFERLKDHLDVGNDETTEDGKVTLEHIECNAACDFAPVMMVNWEFFDNQTPETAVELVDALRSGETVSATRGATITSWRAAERVLAGFEDGLVDEGPAAAGPSLVGLDIARENGWEAPPPGRAGGTATTTATEAPGGDAGPRAAENSPGGDAGPRAAENSTVAAAEESDTARAESETKVAESSAGTRGGGSDDD
jgi:NADH-quinone oxidoreductase subunit E